MKNRLIAPLQGLKPVSAVMAGLLVSQIVFLSACAPPGAKNGPLPGEGGKPIIKVGEKHKPPFKTVVQNGEELLEARGDVGKFGGTFQEITLGEGPKTLNGWDSTDASSSELAAKMHVGLVETDVYTGEVYPLLAKSLTVSPDKKTYRVVLRQGLKWSDGKPLTSDDVTFTWNELIGKGYGNTSQRDVNTVAGKFPSVKAIDPLTVEFTTAEPFAPFARNLGQQIAPAHIFRPIMAKGGKKAFSSTWGVTDAKQHPEKFVSNGLWLLDSYNPVEKRITFKRNPHFFMVDKKGQRLPYLDKYVISYVSDLNNLQLQFEQGNTDIYSVSPDKLALTRKLSKPDFKLYNLGASTGTTFITFNLNNRKNKSGKSYVDPIKSAWFRKQEFRQAIDYAINRQDIVQNILKGVGQPLFTAECLPSIFLNKSIANGHPQDLKKSRELLSKAGFSWKKANGKEQLLDEKGHPVQFTLLTNAGNGIRESIGVQIKDDLAQLGIKVNFKPIEFNVLIGQMDNQDWEAIVMGLTGGTLEPNMGANVWRSEGRLHMFNQREIPDNGNVNLSDRFPWEKQIDDLFDKGVRTFDLEERKAVYNQFQQVAYEQQPFTYLYSGLMMVAAKSRIQNFDPTPLGTLHNLEEIWIKE